MGLSVGAQIENIVNQFVPADQRPALYSAAATVISSVPGAAGLLSGAGGGRSPSSGGGGGGRSPSTPSSQGVFCTSCGPSGPAPAGSPPSSGSPATPAPARGSSGGNGVFDTNAPPATQG